MFLILCLFLACLPASAEPLRGSVAIVNDDNCDWYVWDNHLTWGWATVYSHSGQLKGKYYIIPNSRQYLEAIEDGEEVSIPPDLHPTTPEGIAAAGGIKPLPPISNRVPVTEVAKLQKEGKL